MLYRPKQLAKSASRPLLRVSSCSTLFSNFHASSLSSREHSSPRASSLAASSRRAAHDAPSVVQHQCDRSLSGQAQDLFTKLSDGLLAAETALWLKVVRNYTSRSWFAATCNLSASVPNLQDAAVVPPPLSGSEPVMGQVSNQNKPTARPQQQPNQCATTSRRPLVHRDGRAVTEDTTGTASTLAAAPTSGAAFQRPCSTGQLATQPTAAFSHQSPDDQKLSIMHTSSVTNKPTCSPANMKAEQGSAPGRVLPSAQQQGVDGQVCHDTSQLKGQAPQHWSSQYNSEALSTAIEQAQQAQATLHCSEEAAADAARLLQNAIAAEEQLGLDLHKVVQGRLFLAQSQDLLAQSMLLGDPTKEEVAEEIAQLEEQRVHLSQTEQAWHDAKSKQLAQTATASRVQERAATAVAASASAYEASCRRLPPGTHLPSQPRLDRHQSHFGKDTTVPHSQPLPSVLHTISSNGSTTPSASNQAAPRPTSRGIQPQTAHQKQAAQQPLLPGPSSHQLVHEGHPNDIVSSVASPAGQPTNPLQGGFQHSNFAA